VAVASKSRQFTTDETEKRAMTGASGLGTWVKGNVTPILVSESASSLLEVQRDRGPTRSLELHGSQLGKGPIESGMFSDRSDTIPGHVPVQETQLRS